LSGKEDLAVSSWRQCGTTTGVRRGKIIAGWRRCIMVVGYHERRRVWHNSSGRPEPEASKQYYTRLPAITRYIIIIIIIIHTDTKTSRTTLDFRAIVLSGGSGDLNIYYYIGIRTTRISIYRLYTYIGIIELVYMCVYRFLYRLYTYLVLLNNVTLV